MSVIQPESLRPVLHVSDLEAAIAFYTDVIGCTLDFRYEGIYAGLAWGNVHLHLSHGNGAFNKPVGGSNLYFVMNSTADVDAHYAQIVAKGGQVDKEPQDYPYGMRDFVAFDPDGNMLSFGADTEG